MEVILISSRKVKILILDGDIATAQLLCSSSPDLTANEWRVLGKRLSEEAAEAAQVNMDNMIIDDEG
jgi:hypothetical protein